MSAPVENDVFSPMGVVFIVSCIGFNYHGCIGFRQQVAASRDITGSIHDGRDIGEVGTHMMVFRRQGRLGLTGRREMRSMKTCVVCGDNFGISG